MQTRAAERKTGVTLTELLVVISIMVILMAIMASALGAFRHTSKVDAAADTLATLFREARYYSMAHNVPVTPVILRDTKGRFSAVYAAKVLNFRGSLLETDSAPQTYSPPSAGASNPWSLTRQAMDAPELLRGAFVFMVGSPTLDLNAPSTTAQAFYELMYIKVTPPTDGSLMGPTDGKALLSDSSQYKYEILGRGIHNTALGRFTPATTNYGGADGFMVISNTNVGEGTLAAAEARNYTISDANFPDQVIIDQFPRADEPGDPGPVKATITAQTAVFQEDNLLTAGGGKYFPAGMYPIFLPIFLPDGRVSSGLGRNVLGGLEVNRTSFSSLTGWKPRWKDLTLRVLDTITREERFITIRMANGQAYITTKLPPAYNVPVGQPQDGMPPYEEVFDPTSTSSNSSSTSSTASSSNSSNSSTNSSSTSSTNSNSTSTGRSSTTTTSASSTGKFSTTTASSSTSSTNSSSTSSTGTSSTSSTSNSSNSSTSNTASNSNSSNSTASSASTSGAVGGGGNTSSSGATSSGDGVY